MLCSRLQGDKICDKLIRAKDNELPITQNNKTAEIQ